MLNFKSMEQKSLSVKEAKELGHNMLEGLLPETKSFGEKEVSYEIMTDFSIDILDYLTNDDYISRHIDFRGQPFALIYSMEKSVNVDTVCISGFSAGADSDYMANDFEVYAADNKEDLFSENSLVIKYCREPFKDNYVAKDCIMSVEGTCKYFAVKFNTSCPQDDIGRISRIALFNDFYTASVGLPDIVNTVDLFKGVNPEIIGNYTGKPEYIASGKSLIDEETVTADSDITLRYSTGKTLCFKKLCVIGKNVKVTEITAGGKALKMSEEVNSYYADRNIYTYISDCDFAKSVDIKFSQGSLIDTIFCDTDMRSGWVDFSDVLDRDFIGGGANVIPTQFTEYGIREGYNDVYFELEKHHIEKAKPHCVRMWFQIDWIVDTKEQYENGEWLFYTDEMQSVKRFCQAYMDAGVEIEFNFGWKVGEKVWDWFCTKVENPEMRRNAAPADIYNYGKACAATLEHLILDCGFTNIKYLAFYNEPRTIINCKVSDFNTPGDSIAYLAAMIKYAKYFIDRSRVAGMLEIWGMEECIGPSEIMEKVNILLNDEVDGHTVHMYDQSYENLCCFYEKALLPYKNGKSILLTEYGNCSRTQISYERNHINNLLAGAKLGVSGAFIWVLQGSPLLDPLNWMHSGSDCNNGYSCWGFLPCSVNLDDVGESFYELSLPNHYIPMHANSVNCDTDCKYNDLRINGFYKDGEYTVCVESKGDISAKIEIRLDRRLNRTLYRHTYRHTKAGEGNMTVPSVDKELYVTDTISDNLGEGYTFTVYTTVKPLRQVLMDEVDITLKAGDKKSLGARVVDCEYDITPKFTVSASTCDGAKYENGEIIVPTTAKQGDMFAIKAEIPTGEYGVSIVKVV